MPPNKALQLTPNSLFQSVLGGILAASVLSSSVGGQRCLVQLSADPLGCTAKLGSHALRHEPCGSL